MRTLADVQRDIDALGRPVLNPFAIYKSAGGWPELQVWREANPSGEEEYRVLWEERDKLEAEAARRSEFDAATTSLGAGLRISKALGAFEETPASRAALDWWRGQRNWLVILGHTGIGKSVAAAAVARTVKGSVWCPATTLMTQVAFEDNAARLSKCQLLVLDDYGTEHQSPFAKSCWHQVLAERHENEKRTILTANLTRPQLRQALGDRLADRIASDCVMVEFQGASLRRGR